MPFNGSGTYTRVYTWTTDAAGTIPITASRFDTQETDMATALSNCITKDGQQTITADIPFNTHKITGLGNPVGAQDAATRAFVLAPSAAVVGTASFTGTAFIPTGSSVPANGIYLPSANTLGFATNGANVGAWDASGNLGLGVTPSAWGGAGNIQAQNNFVWSGYDGSIGGNYYYNGGYKYIATGPAVSRYSPLSGNHTWMTAPAGTAGNPITFTTAMTLDASGYLTLNGTTSQIVSIGTYNNTTANAANMYVYASGNFARSTSALKYKQDIRDLPPINVDLFRPILYKSKCKDDDQTVDHIGIIADEVAAAGITQLVTYNTDGEVEGFQYERLTVVLLKEVQSLRARLAVLEAK